MNRDANRLLGTLLRPPLVVLRWLLGTGFSVPFGMLDRRIAGKHQERLLRDVKDTLPFLFAEWNGRPIPNDGVPFPPAFDYAFVSISLDDVLLRFSRGRGELGVGLAPTFAPSSWHDLSLVIGALGADGEIERKAFPDLGEVSRVLEPNIKAVIELFSLARFESLKTRLDDEVYSQDRVAIRAWEIEINRKLYGR